MDTARSLGEFEHLVLLAILRLQSSGAYGVSIRAEIAKHTDRDPAPGAIYVTLDRLEKKGFIKSRTGEPTPRRGGRSKRYYQVTASGLRSVRRARREQRSLARGIAVLGDTNA